MIAKSYSPHNQAIHVGRPQNKNSLVFKNQLTKELIILNHHFQISENLYSQQVYSRNQNNCKEEMSNIIQFYNLFATCFETLINEMYLFY